MRLHNKLITMTSFSVASVTKRQLMKVEGI